MGEIHRIKKNGKTIYPATITEAVVDKVSKKPLNLYMNDIIPFTVSCNDVIYFDNSTKNIVTGSGNIIITVNGFAYTIPKSTTFSYPEAPSTSTLLALLWDKNNSTFILKDVQKVVFGDICLAVLVVKQILEDGVYEVVRVTYSFLNAIIKDIPRTEKFSTLEDIANRNVYWSSNDISINTSENTIKIGEKGYVTFFIGDRSLDLRSLSCSIKQDGEKSIIHRIILNTNTKKIYPKAQLKVLSKEEAVICQINFKTQDISSQFSNLGYSGGPINIDGVLYNDFSNPIPPIVRSYCNDVVYFDNINHKIRIGSGNLIIRAFNKEYVIQKNTEIQYPLGPVSTSLFSVIYDINSKSLIWKQYNTVSDSDFVLFNISLLGYNSYDVKYVFSPYVNIEILNNTKSYPEYRYFGDSFNIIEKTFSKKELVRLSYKTNQSFARYENLLIAIESVDGEFNAYIFNIGTGILLSKLILPYDDFHIPHANVSCFGTEIKDENSIAPLLYISQWDDSYERGCLVYNFTKTEENYNVELVQKIKPVDIEIEKIGEGSIDYVIDTDNNTLYTLSYFKKNGSRVPEDEGNKQMICKFKLPDLSAGYNIELKNEDILENFSLEPFNIGQDKCYNNGNIFIISGSPEYPDWTLIRVLDLNKKQITARIPLNMYGGEPECIDTYQGKIIFSGYSTNGNLDVNTVYYLDLN